MNRKKSDPDPTNAKKRPPASKNGSSTVELDQDLLAIVDAQCAEYGTERSKFLQLVVRLFIDFSYMARVVGKDIFAFRDEMIKAIVRGKGNVPGSGANLPGTALEEASDAAGGSPVEKKLDEVLGELAEIKFIFKLIKRLARRKNINIEKLISSIEAEDFAGKMNRMEDIKNITVDHLASGFRNSPPPTYGDRRRKLQKIRF